MPPFLTETAVKAVKPAEKARKIYDERGLFLFVPPTGARLWRMRYQIGGREKLLALGEWPHTSLKRARERRNRQVLIACSPFVTATSMEGFHARQHGLRIMRTTSANSYDFAQKQM